MAFALSTFFPEQVQPAVDYLCKVSYRFANMCKLVDAVQACLKQRHIATAKAKAENRKKALKMLQNEISKKEEVDSEALHDGQADIEAGVVKKKPVTEEEEWQEAIEANKALAASEESSVRGETAAVVKDDEDEDGEFDEVEI